MSENVIVRYPDPPPPRWWSIVLHDLLIAFMAFASGLMWSTYFVARAGLERVEQQYVAARAAKAEGDAYRDRAKALLGEIQKQAPTKPHNDRLEPSNADHVSRL